MITQAESGLSAADYAKLKENLGYFAKSVELRRRNLDFTEHPASFGTPTSSYLFDVFQWDDKTWQAYVDSGTLKVRYLDNEDGGDDSWLNRTNIATSVSNVRPSFGYPDNGKLRVFYAKEDGVYMAYTDNDGVSWTTAMIIDITDAQFGGLTNLTYLAADGYNRLFMAFLRTDNTTVFFAAEILSGSTWTVLPSDIYWPHPITGMAADSIGAITDYKRFSIIVITSDLPSEVIVKLQGTSASSAASRRNGIALFRYRNWRWGDHREIERFDDASAYLYRAKPFLTRCTAYGEADTKLMLTTYGVDGTESHSHQSINYYFSKDGKFWSQNEKAVIGSGMSNGAGMVVNGNYTYLVGSGSCYRSYTTELTGTPPAAIVEDITDRIVSYSSQQSGIRSSTYGLRNDDDWYESSFFSEDGIFSLIVELGVWVGSNQRTVQIAHEIVDSRGYDRRAPDRTLTIKARDYGALMNTMVRSAHARLVDTQVLGADLYTDTTGTGYGGLAHLAAIRGSFSTESNWLRLRSNNERGMGQMTFGNNIWNGMVETSFQITDPSSNFPTGQYAGVFFRCIDKDNYYTVYYNENDDQISLCEIRGGEETTIETTGNMSWTYGNTYWLRVIWHYSRVIAYYSTDGIEWSFALTDIVPNKTGTILSGVPLMFEEGSVGVIGAGYSDEDTWDADPGEFLTDPYYTAAETSHPVWMYAGCETIAVFDRMGYVIRTSNFSNASPTWEVKSIDEGTPGVYYRHTSNYIVQFVADAFSPGLLGTGTEVNGWLFSMTGIYYLEDMFGACNLTKQHTLTSATYVAADASFAEQGFVVCVQWINGTGGGTKCHYTTDGGSTWNETWITSVEHSNEDRRFPGCYVSSKTAGLVYATAFQSYGTGRGYYSTDYGATWSVVDGTNAPNMALVDSLGQDLHVPWNDNDDEMIVYYRGGAGNGDHGQLRRSALGDGGQIIAPSAGSGEWGPAWGRWSIVSAWGDRTRLAACLYDTYWDSGVKLFTSLNEGTLWTQRTTSSSVRGVAIAGDEDECMYMWGKSGWVAYSQDFGDTIEDKRGNMNSLYYGGSPWTAQWFIGIAGGPPV